MKLQTVKGDATNPIRVYPNGYEQQIIVHCCNDIGAWGAGFVIPLAKKWPQTKLTYQANIDRQKLGDIQLIQVHKSPTLTQFVCNLIGQKNIKPLRFNRIIIPPIRYEAIKEGLIRLRLHLNTTKIQHQVSLHSPRFGCGLAGGKWENIQECIEFAFGDTNIVWTVYDLG